jgi:hypothetical protein
MSVKVKIPFQRSDFREGVKKINFPQVYDDTDILIDTSLKPINLIPMERKKSHLTEGIDVIINLNIDNHSANVFLILNGRKVDMFYSIVSGEYSFRNVVLVPGKNVLEIYYLIGRKKSPSVFITQIE